MSKKETRRAARQAFPKAKGATPAKSRTSGGAYTRRTAGNRSRSAPASRVPRPPTIKRSLIYGVIWAVIYFVFISWVWKTAGSTLQVNAILSVLAVFLFSGVFYFVDWYKYRRYVRKQKGSSK